MFATPRYFNMTNKSKISNSNILHPGGHVVSVGQLRGNHGPRNEGKPIDCNLLRLRFTKSVVWKHWKQNNHDLKEISCVYVLVSVDIFQKELDIQYIGSTKGLYSRYKSHKIPGKIQEMGFFSVMYYLPMESGFYDYEKKLIKKLKPKFNIQHKWH